MTWKDEFLEFDVEMTTSLPIDEDWPNSINFDIEIVTSIIEDAEF